MANIIGEPLNGYVVSQINARQKLHGSGAGQDPFNPRNDFQINLLNSNTSWIKLASGVSVSEERLAEIGLGGKSFSNMGLAKNYILYAGISKLGTSSEGYIQTQQREGFNPQQPDSSYTYGDYGYSPMPGIISADIKALNRGSLKKANVKLTVNNKQQFDIIDLLYLRLGYTVLLEWGNSVYTPDGVTRKTVRNTLTETLFFEKGGKGSYLDMLNPIEERRAKYRGNYDALLGKVSNFSWSFKEDGSYDIEITIISLGDVIESLKTNIPTDIETIKFLNQTTSRNTSTPSSPDTSPEEPDIIEENKDANAIASMLYIWKFLNNTNESIKDEINIKAGDGAEYPVGGFLNSTQEGSTTISTNTWTVDFTIRYEEEYSYERTIVTQGGEVTTVTDTDTQWVKVATSEDPSRLHKVYTQAEWPQKYYDDRAKLFEYYQKIAYQKNVNINQIKTRNQTTTIDNPLQLTKVSKKDAFAFKTLPKPQYYLRFGFLLEYVRDNILPKIKTDNTDGNPPIFDIDSDPYDNHMFSLPNQISLDPRVCVVRNDNFNTSAKDNTQVFSQLDLFREVDNKVSQNQNAAYPMNIYLNFNFILECLKADERGDINMYDFIKSMCDGLNKALGGINNLEPVIDEIQNVLKIVDTTPIPGYSSEEINNYTLQLYGYDKTSTGYISNFIRNVDLKTAITPEFATMITVGATAGGYVKGVEATAFSKWNVGLVDRFKEEFIPGNPQSVTPSGSMDEAESNYIEKFITEGYYKRYGFSSITANNIKISDDIIEGNLSVGTEYFKYIMAKNQSNSGGTIGFIPFKISFTMDGLSGIKIYNKLNVDTRFLPRAYGNNLDLIVTGVSHKLSKNDWETDIEATVIPKTKGDVTIGFSDINAAIQQSSGGVDKISSCKELPPPTGLSSSSRKIIKSTSTQKDAVNAIINHLEGGYYHPAHSSNFSIKDKDLYKNSGETLYGLDRVAGGWMKSPKGREFWKKVDQISGYGKYSLKNSDTVTKSWDLTKFPPIPGALRHYSKPNSSSLLNEAKSMIEERFNKDLENNFGGHPLKNIILNDGRLLFMWYRATWNGSGYFQKYSRNIKKEYDKGEKNIDKLICADLTYRYNTKKGDFKKGVSKMSYLIDYNPS